MIYVHTYNIIIMEGEKTDEEETEKHLMQIILYILTVASLTVSVLDGLKELFE